MKEWSLISEFHLRHRMGRRHKEKKVWCVRWCVLGMPGEIGSKAGPAGLLFPLSFKIKVERDGVLRPTLGL